MFSHSQRRSFAACAFAGWLLLGCDHDDESLTPEEESLPRGVACDPRGKDVGRVVQLASGESSLVGAFLTEAGVLIVTADRVRLVDQRGKSIARLTPSGPIESAVFDGATLVITERSEFVSYDANLAELGRGELLSPCSNAVLVGENHLVCGELDTDAIYYTYDVLTGFLVASTSNHTFPQGPIRRVPGRDAFVTINANTTPKDFFLFSVDARGEVKYEAATPYHGDFRISSVYAFAGDPATQLITDEGLLLCLDREDCGDSESGLVLVGDVGPLPDETYYGAMHVDPYAKLHAIAGPDTRSFSDEPTCDTGCTLERRDIASQAVEAELPIRFESSVFVTLLANPSGGVLLGCGYGPYNGHRVLLLLDAP